MTTHPDLTILELKLNSICILIAEARQIKAEHPELRVGHALHPGSILNAYREGDLTFGEAVAELERWRDRHG